MKKKFVDGFNEVAVNYPLSFKLGCDAIMDSGGCHIEPAKWYVVEDDELREKLARCEKFMEEHKNDIISHDVFEKATRMIRRHQKKIGCENYPIECFTVGDRFISGNGGECTEMEYIAKAMYSGKELKEYRNYDLVIAEIFDGDLRDCIVVS